MSPTEKPDKKTPLSSFAKEEKPGESETTEKKAKKAKKENY